MTFKDECNGDIIGLNFQVTDVEKPLLAVRRLVEKGNMVQFGPTRGRTKYITNVETGKTIKMEKRGGPFAIKANFAKRLERDRNGFPWQAW